MVIKIKINNLYQCIAIGMNGIYMSTNSNDWLVITKYN